MDFKTWKRRVNAIILDRLGVDCDDLTDYPYFNAWKDERFPSEVAYELLVREGIYA